MAKLAERPHKIIDLWIDVREHQSQTKACYGGDNERKARIEVTTDNKFLVANFEPIANGYDCRQGAATKG